MAARVDCDLCFFLGRHDGFQLVCNSFDHGDLVFKDDECPGRPDYSIANLRDNCGGCLDPDLYKLLVFECGTGNQIGTDIFRIIE